jgi:hypothetical protein
MKSIAFILLLLTTAQVYAGDYMLYVADKDNSSKCADQTHWTVNTSEEVADSFDQYFSGKKPDIGILRASFANGHFHFCGSKEIENVLKTLYKIKEKGPRANKNHINDFIDKIEAIK